MCIVAAMNAARYQERDMTVQELIDELLVLPQDAEVVDSEFAPWDIELSESSNEDGDLYQRLRGVVIMRTNHG